MHIDPKVEQLEVAAGIFQVYCRIDLVGVWQNIRAIAFLKGN